VAECQYRAGKNKYAFCELHYRERLDAPYCVGPDCTRRSYTSSRRLCRSHYLQAYHGKPLKPIRPRRRDDLNDPEKQCRTCERWLPRSEFYRRAPTKKGILGWSSDCKRCCIARVTRRYRLKRGTQTCAVTDCAELPERDRKCFDHWLLGGRS
jgi:hypothetical protein